MRGCLFCAPGEGYERSFSRGSAVRSANKMCPRVSYSGSCGVGGTHAQAQIRRKRGERTRTDGDTDSELMASELRLGFSENYYFFEGWAVGGTRMLSMVDRLFDKGFVKLFRLILMKK